MVRERTKDQQWKRVCEGLAVACTVLGVESLPGKPLPIESSFSYAWRRWGSRSKFPSINPRDFKIYVWKSRTREMVYGYWTWDGDLAPHLSHDWSAREHLGSLAEGEDVSEAEWLEFASAFVDDVVSGGRSRPERRG